MHHVSRVRIAEFNENFACGLCFCYIIDATTIAECLHSCSVIQPRPSYRLALPFCVCNIFKRSHTFGVTFGVPQHCPQVCRSCLVQYLKLENCCPLCGQLVHKTKPLDYVHPDNTLQAIIYKMVPGLLECEVERRREFYALHPEAEPGRDLPEANEALSLLRLEQQPGDVVDSDFSSLSVCLQAATRFSYPGSSLGIPAGFKRYLLCNAYMPISHLKKFIRLKFVLPHEQRISIFYADEDLPDYYTLTDIAELYSWRRLAPLDLFYIVCNASTVQKTSTLLWSRRHLKYSKKCAARYRNTSKLLCQKRISSSDIPRLKSSNAVCEECTSSKFVEATLTRADSSSNFGIKSTQLSNNSCDTDRTTGKLALSEDKSLTPCPSAFTLVESSSKRTPSIWRLVDDRMERSVPEPEGESTNMNAQIFSRSEKETLYSPRFFGDRRTTSDAIEGHSETSVSDDAEYHFQPIFSPGAADSIDARSTMISDTVSPKPVYPHFKKRLLLGASESTKMTWSTTQLEHGRPLSPTVIGSSPRTSSFTIHQDRPSSCMSTASSSQILSFPRCLQNTTNTIVTTPVVPAKIGIVISHGRAMTLQDKLQRMSNSSSPAPTLSSMWSSSDNEAMTNVDNAASSSTAVLHRKQAVGHRSRDKTRKNSHRQARVKSRTMKTTMVQNEVENESRSHLSATTGSVKRPCHRKRSELQLLLQLDGGPLAASAEFRRANALRCRDNQQGIASPAWTAATALKPTFGSSRPGSSVGMRTEDKHHETNSDERQSISEAPLPTEYVGFLDSISSL